MVIPEAHTLATKNGTLVCPQCKGRLESRVSELRCDRCQMDYRYKEGIACFMVGGGERFTTGLSEEGAALEERANARMTADYVLPLVRRISGQKSVGLRLLSVGCGVGVDVDLYRRLGIIPVLACAEVPSSQWYDR